MGWEDSTLEGRIKQLQQLKRLCGAVMSVWPVYGLKPLHDLFMTGPGHGEEHSMSRYVLGVSNAPRFPVPVWTGFQGRPSESSQIVMYMLAISEPAGACCKYCILL